jgi:mxaJ protein
MCSRFLRNRLGISAMKLAVKRLTTETLTIRRGTQLLCAVIALIFIASACARQSSRPLSTNVSTVPLLNKPAGVLRVCADPNNLPFSNEQQQGFENKIAELLARDLHERLEYTWWAQRRGFFRNTLKSGTCDLVIGVPAGFEMALTTSPYYRSTYVFLTRKDRNLNVQSLDDSRLRDLKVGVQMVGDDFSNSPPAHALTSRGIITNVKGFTLYGDYAQPNPPARIIEAVARGDVDVAIVWGPLAGYFAKQSRIPLAIDPVSPQVDQTYLPFVYDIAMGVRHGDNDLRDQVEQVIEKRRDEIDRILADYGVPRVDVVQDKTAAANKTTEASK